ncbi:MAG: hypothetical protein A2Z12_05100 [Actinobacteria bacterium RBG_16_68_21]|nr:MAG: hypothetical protein A2Z12_05100 [Actinobacteria bacterium RBG_16_68_21]
MKSIKALSVIVVLSVATFAPGASGAEGPVTHGSRGMSTCFGRTATLVGTNGDDLLEGGPGSDVIDGRGGNDTINGLGGKDYLCGGAGDDTINGGGGRDRIKGQGGDDAIDGGAGTDFANGGSGTDECLAESTRRCEESAVPDTVEVSIKSLAFHPATLTVVAGTTVRWTNNESSDYYGGGALTHTVTSTSELWEEQVLGGGAAYEFTFEAPGTYAYMCTIHPSMTGTVTVTG